MDPSHTQVSLRSSLLNSFLVSYPWQSPSCEPWLGLLYSFCGCCYLLSPWLETPSLTFMIKETYVHQIRLSPPFTISKNDDATMLMNQFQHCLASRDPPSFTHCKYRVHTHCSHSYLASVRDTWDTQRPFHMKFCVNNDHFAYWWGTFYPDIQP